MRETRFKTKIDIDPKQKEWIKENREKFGYKTNAGFLDVIINSFKKHENKN